jgi:chromosome segregation ATPase
MSEETTQNLPNDNMGLILARLDSIDSRLDSVDSRLGSVDSRLTTLEDKVDKRLQETRPIWERALAEIAETRAEMHEEFGKVRSEIDVSLRRVVRQIDVLNHNILEVRGDLRYLDDRVTKLETEPAQ